MCYIVINSISWKKNYLVEFLSESSSMKVSQNGMSEQFFLAFLSINPNLRIVGFKARQSMACSSSWMRISDTLTSDPEWIKCNLGRRVRLEQTQSVWAMGEVDRPKLIGYGVIHCWHVFYLILGLFHALQKMKICAAVSHAALPWWTMTWNLNIVDCQTLHWSQKSLLSVFKSHCSHFVTLN